MKFLFFYTLIIYIILHEIIDKMKFFIILLHIDHIYIRVTYFEKTFFYTRITQILFIF